MIVLIFICDSNSCSFPWQARVDVTTGNLVRIEEGQLSIDLVEDVTLLAALQYHIKPPCTCEEEEKKEKEGEEEEEQNEEEKKRQKNNSKQEKSEAISLWGTTFQTCISSN